MIAYKSAREIFQEAKMLQNDSYCENKLNALRKLIAERRKL